MKRHPIRGDAQANLLFTISNEHADTRRYQRNFVSFRCIRSTSSTARELVEPDGIEPTTSCLQSTRSPN